MIPLATEKESKWLRKFFDEKPDGFWTVDQISDCKTVDDRVMGFSYELVGAFNRAARFPRSFDWYDELIIYAEKTGDTEQVVQILKRFLLESGTEMTQIGFSYAYTCNRPRVGEFGGGALLVSLLRGPFPVKKGARDCKVEYIDTAEWLAKKGDSK
jgi:hypothetical protein